MTRRRWLAGAGGLLSCARDHRPRLNVYNWSTYIDPAMLARFERERGVRLRYSTYESNEEMLAKAMTGNSGWDVVFPTHSRLAPMASSGSSSMVMRPLSAGFQRPLQPVGAAVCAELHAIPVAFHI